MTQLDLKSRSANILEEAATKLRTLIFEAAHAVQAEVGKCELDLKNGEKAIVDLAHSSITIAGEHVKSALHLSEIVDALHKAPGIAGAAVKNEVVKTELAAVEAVDNPVASVDKTLAVEAEKLNSELN